MILVTGANGFIGRNLVKYLSENDIDALASSRRSYDNYFDTLNVPFIELDITQKADFSRIRENIDTIVHLATAVPSAQESPSLGECINISGIGTFNTLEFCRSRNIARFVYISSRNVIGNPQYSPVDETHPVNPKGKYADYGIGKVLGELFCERFRKEAGLNCICLRLPMIYGYGQKQYFLVPRLIKSVQENKKIIIYGTREFELDLLYINDVIAAIMLALKSNCQGIYNIGTGQGVSLGELAGMISYIFAAGKAKIVNDTSRSSDGMGFHFDISKAKRELGFEPRYSLTEGLSDMKNQMQKINKTVKEVAI